MNDGSQFDEVAFVGIDYGGGLVSITSLDPGSIAQMDMSVDKVTGGIFVQQIPERFKAGVGQIRAVPQLPGRGVGQKDVKAFLSPQGKGKLSDPPVHLPVCVLIFAGFITHGTPKPQDSHAFMLIDFSVDADTTVRRCLFITVIVISAHIQDGALEKGGEERQIVGMQIPAGEDQVDPLKFAFFKEIPQVQGFLVCEYQYFHSASFDS